MSFDREQARGFWLDVPAGTSVRFEPRVSRTVYAVASYPNISVIESAWHLIHETGGLLDAFVRPE